MRVHKLRSGVYWQGALIQKGLKQGGNGTGSCVKFETLTLVLLGESVFRDVTPASCWVKGLRRFGVTCPGRFRMKAVRFFETSGTTYPVTQCHITKTYNPKSNVIVCIEYSMQHRGGRNWSGMRLCGDAVLSLKCLEVRAVVCGSGETVWSDMSGSH
jgi:hypothetical protein